jgi:DNA-binding NarL/FixJ family response regulator
MTATLLLVEDEDDTRDLLARALDRAGFRTLTAASVAAALSLARSAAFEIVITDVVMGADDLAGLTLMTELDWLGIRAPVIVITAFADVHRVKTALNQGAAYFLEKPFSASDLLAAVERVRKAGRGAEATMQRLFERAALTDKERTVARHLFDGLSGSEIAEREHNSPRTIRQHISQIYAKCGVGNRAEFLRLLFPR